MQRERPKVAGARSNLGVIARLSVEGGVYGFPTDGGE
jgi:hypothetical protein|tara:strand:+ start:842 stop:952 length:111 start_codon:yes stop_codon:yes gene_type:complete